MAEARVGGEVVIAEVLILMFACSLSFLFGGLLAMRGIRLRLYDAGEALVEEGLLRRETLVVLLDVLEGRR